MNDILKDLQALSDGVHPNFTGVTRGQRAQYMYTSHPGLPDIDVDIEGACNLGNVALYETVEIEGKEYPVPPLDSCRYVVYDKQIQHVRNVKSFLLHHKANPGSLEHLMTNMVWAQLLDNETLEAMYSRGRNQQHDRPTYTPHYDNAIPYYMSMHAFGKLIPLRLLIEKSQRWLQGIIMETHGIQGIEMIKRAKEKAADKLKIEMEKEQDLYMEGSGVGFELNEPVLIDTVKAMVSAFGQVSVDPSGAYTLVAKALEAGVLNKNQTRFPVKTLEGITFMKNR